MNASTAALRSGVVLAVCLLSAQAAGARDWPQWGGSNGRNMVSPEKNLPATFHPGTRLPTGGIDADSLENIRWIAPLGSDSYAAPTVAGGRVYVGTNDRCWRDPRVMRSGGGVLMCLDEATGRLRWRLLVPRYKEKVLGSGFDDMNLGICSSPTLDGTRLYVVTNRAEVLCLDAAGLTNGNDGPFRAEGQYMAGPGKTPVPLRPGDADIVWRFDMISQLPSAPHDATNCSPLLHGNALYVGTSNGVHRIPDEPTPLPDAPSLIVLHRKTGRLIARDAEKIGRRVFHGQWSSPSLGRVGDKTLIFFGAGDGVCYAFEAVAPAAARAARPAKLRKVWWYDCNPKEYRLRDGQPVEYWDGDASRADVKKNFKGPSEIIATPVFHNGRVYVAVGRDPVHGEASGILHCIDATRRGNVTKSGCIWSYRKIDRSMSTVAVADGLLYAADVAGTVHCLSAKTGKPYWVHRTNQPIWSSPYVADGKVYVGTQRKRLWVFRAGRTKKVLAKIKLPFAVPTTPVAANGVLYVAASRFLYAVCPDRP